MKTSVLAGALSLIVASPSAAQDLRGPDMAVASNFGQGYLADLMEAARANGIRDFRDAVYWDRVEQPDGTFAFTTDETLYPDIIAGAGAVMSLTVNNGHPAYQDGATPTDAAAVAAFGRHVAETAARFPAITAIEVGNEFNSANFVSGPLRDAGLAARADAYVALLKSVATQTRARRPDVRIIGGGVHSIPTGYLDALMERGAGAYMDTLALHPYSTPVEHYAKQISVMRRNPLLADIPVEITEFGTQSPDLAAGKLIRSHCQYALAGASRLAWYALNERGDDYVPLITRDGSLTPTWDAFTFAQTHLAGKSVRDVTPDPFTYACHYDDRTLVIWGAPRDMTLNSPDITAVSATGAPLSDRAFTLSETDPVILMSDEPITLEQAITLAPQTILADSYHGFSYSDGPETTATPGGFIRSVVGPSGETPVQTMPGQAREGRPWTPWLGIPDNGDIRLLPRTLLPGGTAQTPFAIQHSYVSDTAQAVDLDIFLAPSDRSTDGVVLSVESENLVLHSETITEAETITLTGIALIPGTTLKIIVGPGDTATGDITDYRFTLRARP